MPSCCGTKRKQPEVMASAISMGLHAMDDVASPSLGFAMKGREAEKVTEQIGKPGSMVTCFLLIKANIYIYTHIYIYIYINIIMFIKYIL